VDHLRKLVDVLCLFCDGAGQFVDLDKGTRYHELVLMPQVLDELLQFLLFLLHRLRTEEGRDALLDLRIEHALYLVVEDGRLEILPAQGVVPQEIGVLEHVDLQVFVVFRCILGDQIGLGVYEITNFLLPYLG
jgi:hypothetical protein